MTLFSMFPRQVGRHRKLVYTREQFLNYVNHNNGFTDVFTSIYSFTALDEKGKVRRESAVVDKVFWDFDPPKPLHSFLPMHMYLTENDIKHTCVFTGNGFHIYAFCNPKEQLKNKRAALAGCQREIAGQAMVDFDEHVAGNLVQIARIPGTRNMKPGCNRYCVPMSWSPRTYAQDELEKIFEYAAKPEMRWRVWGKKILSLSTWDTEEADVSLSDISVPIAAWDGDVINTEPPPCVVQLLQIGGHHERFLSILALHDLGWNYQEIAEVMKTYLSRDKLIHSLKEERQIDQIFERPDLILPVEKVRSYGRCSDCPIKVSPGGDKQVEKTSMCPLLTIYR